MKSLHLDELIVFILFMVIGIIFALVIIEADNDYQDCERYNAARIPQNMNPCWGDVRKSK